MKLKQSQLPLALALAMVAGQAQALGLGQIEVKSGLGQPLLAEIPILSATSEELENLEVRLASPDAFARVGLERPTGLAANLEMRLSHNQRGQPVVLVTTSSKFNEPFLTFLVEANWGKGSVVREFSALVDPPYIAPAVIRPLETPAVASAPAPVAPPPPPTPEPPTPEPVPEPEPVEASTVAVVEPEPAPVAAIAEPPPAPQPVTAPASPPEPPAPEPVAAAEPAPPQPVAAPPPPPRPVAPPAPRPPPPPAPAAKPDTYGPVSSGQTLWTIAENVRPDPSVTVNQMMLALQRANPDAFIDDNINRLKRGAVLRIPAPDDIARISAAQAAALVRDQALAWQAKRSPAPQPATAVERPAATPGVAASKPAVSEARLSIVPPAAESSAARNVQSGASSAGGGTEIRAELSEAKAQLSQAREDLAARETEVQELRSRVADLEKMQDDRQRVIDLQNSQLKALQDRLAQLEAEGDAAPAADPAVTEAPTEVAAEVSGGQPVAEAPAETPAAEPAPAAATPEPVSEPWYMNPMAWGGGAVALLLAFWLARRGRGKAAPASRPRISDDDALRATLAKASAGSAAAAVEADEEEPVEEPAAEPVAEPVAEPIAEAPAAAGDPREAELLAAVVANPDDLDRHLELLRHYHQKRDAMAFETAAAKMHGHVGNPRATQWREAVVMGMSLAPRNPLFNDAGWNQPAFTPEPEPVPDDEPLARELGEEPTLQRPAVPAIGESIDEMEAPAELAAELSMEPEAAALAEVDIAQVEEDWDRLTAGLAPQAEADEEAEAAIDLGAFDAAPDVHRAEAEVLAEDEGSATKIELAKAYLEIGDADGARAMLEEVVADGGPAAKAEAERLLKEIG